MNIYLILSIIGTVWFSICLAILLICFGIPESLSHNYYSLGGRSGRGFFFYLYLAVTVFLMIIPMVEAAKLWGFLTGFGILFVGAAPAFKRTDSAGGIEHILHPIGAFLAAAASIALLIYIHQFMWIFIALLLAWCLATNTHSLKRSYVFWMEMVAFYSLFGGVICHFCNVV